MQALLQSISASNSGSTSSISEETISEQRKLLLEDMSKLLKSQSDTFTKSQKTSPISSFTEDTSLQSSDITDPTDSKRLGSQKIQSQLNKLEEQMKKTS